MNGNVHHLQAARNRESRGRWFEYTAHRERIGTCLLEPAFRDGRLLVLGAGNCNDLDLEQLVGHFSEVHLVDLDTEAMADGMKRQGVEHERAIHLHGNLELTGVAEMCSRWRPGVPPVPSEFNATLAVAKTYKWPFPEGYFDVAASVGLLSQLVETMILAVGESDPHAVELWAAVRLRHMQLLTEAVRPGGRIVLVTEIVSSTTCPELAEATDATLPGLVKKLINSRNFFTGLNPAVLELLWRQAPQLAPWIEQVELSRPWLWNFGPRVYACCALRGVRRSHEGPF